VAHTLAEEREQSRLPFKHVTAHQSNLFNTCPNGRACERTETIPGDEHAALKAKHRETALGVVTLLCTNRKEVVVVQVQREAEVQGVQPGPTLMDELEEGIPAAAVIHQKGS